MGWVTLSLRQMEDKVLVNNLELQLIQLSRRRMQLLRKKNVESVRINNEKREAVKAAKGTSGIADAQSAIQDAFNNLKTVTKDIAEAGGNATDQQKADKEKYQTELSEAQTNYNLANVNYQDTKETVSSLYDDMLSELEAETTEEENQLDMEQTEIETQLQAIRAELEAVGQQVSADIKSTTIKLG